MSPFRDLRGAVWFLLCSLTLVGCSAPSPKSNPVAGSASMGILAASPSDSTEPSGGLGGVESVEPWSYNSNDGRLVRTSHYRLFTTAPDTVLNSRVPLFLEASLDAYRTALTGTDSPLPEPTLKLDTYIMRNRADWALLTRQTTGEHADTFLRIQRGGFAFGGKALLFDIGAHDTMAITAHEGWHQYTQRAFARPLPIWLEEGIATYMEGHRFDGKGAPRFLPWLNTERFDQLRRAQAQGRLMSLTALLDSSPQNLLGASAPGSNDALVYYAQVWALTHFLADGANGKYRSALGTLLRDAASGAIDQQLVRTLGVSDAKRFYTTRRGPGVFEAYFGDLTEASHEYDRFMGDLVQPGSRGAVVAGMSPLEGDKPTR